MHRKIALVASNAPAAMEAEAELRPLYDFVELAEADLLIALGGDGLPSLAVCQAGEQGEQILPVGADLDAQCALAGCGQHVSVSNS